MLRGSRSGIDRNTRGKGKKGREKVEMDSWFVDDTELSDKPSQTSFPRFLSRHQLCSQQDRPRNGSLVSHAGALVGIEVEAFFASADDTLAVNTSYGVCALDEGAVLAFADAQASTAGLAVDTI